MHNKKLYDIWRQMKKRCYRKENSNYKWYGARGVKVCKSWANSFQAFYKWAIKHGYKEGLSLDRKNNNGNYSPQNCRWATIEEQASNTRKNVFYTVKGETHTLSEWARLIHRSKGTVHEGIKRNGISYIEKRLERS